ncbi:MAG: septum formation initiator family protein [Eggerthellaceae bacterium]|nr:septum formation initiator family protein [Eggerthellaceae bacterium]
MSRQAHIVSFDDAKRNSARRGASSYAHNDGRWGSAVSSRRGSGQGTANSAHRGAGQGAANSARRSAGENNPRSTAAKYRSQAAKRSSSATIFADEDFYASLNFADDFGARRAGFVSDSYGQSRGAARGAGYASASYARGSYDDVFARESRVSDDLEARFGGAADDDEFDVEEANAKLNPISRMKMRMDRSKRSKAKAKAGKEFARRYGDSGPSDASAGPRAAVYKGEMGSQHKRATRLQGDSAVSQSAGSSGKAGRPKRKITSSRWFIASCGVAACIAFCCMFLYTPAQQCYQEMRERDRLELEYQAIVDRNEKLQQSVNYLSTDAGVEDQARADFGWIREGERAVSVSGLTVDEELNFTANIVSSDVKPPHTWYSDFLDPIFGVS